MYCELPRHFYEMLNSSVLNVLLRYITIIQKEPEKLMMLNKSLYIPDYISKNLSKNNIERYITELHDGVLWFIKNLLDIQNEQQKKNIVNYQHVSLHRKILKQWLSEHYLTVKDLLLSKGVIEIIDKYKINSHSEIYSLTSAWQDNLTIINHYCPVKIKKWGN
jgi:hypothetical protein